MQGKSVVLKQYGTAREALEIKMADVAEPNVDELLVEIKAASINPIDCRMRSGYGRTIFKSITDLPITLGRDFSGVVKKAGKDVSDFKIGDEVWGVVSPGRPLGLKFGSYSEYITIPFSECIKKPANIDHISAASLPYVALTTWSALINQFGKSIDFYKGKKVLVHAGAGGVGSFAIQFLKQLGATVATTCSTGNVSFVRSLGADIVIDYTTCDYEEKLPKDFDIIYDLLGKTHKDKSLNLLRSRPFSAKIVAEIDKILALYLDKLNAANDEYTFPKYRAIIKEFDQEIGKLVSSDIGYVSIVGPMMTLTDEKGFHAGMRQYITETLQKKAAELKFHGRWFAYAVYEPNRVGLEYITEMVRSGKISPNVTKIFSLEETAAAHEAVDSGHVRGKVVVKVDSGYSEGN